MTGSQTTPHPPTASAQAGVRPRRPAGATIPLGIASILLLLAFRTPFLDLAAARLFYAPGGTDHWPAGQLPCWRVAYAAAPVLVVLFAMLAGVAVLVGLALRRAAALFAAGLFMLLCLALGPGLLVNGALKGAWGRPRPLEIREFGGQAAYHPPHLPTWPRQGKSFPSGHASVGFVFASLFFLLHERRPWTARLVFAGSTLLGLLLGVARMASGTHFLSDVLWAGVLTVAVCAALHHLAWRRLERAFADRRQDSGSNASSGCG